MNINERLLEIQREWIKSCGADEIAKEVRLSRPFSFAVTKEYVKNQNKVMVIGQEARDFGEYADNWPLIDVQHFNEDYVSIQLGYRAPHDEVKYNSSPFWKFFRELKKREMEPVWNNVDKFHLVKEIDHQTKKTESLRAEQERVFSAPYGPDSKSILIREVETVAPDIIVFLTGPYYHETMALALGISDKELCAQKPNKSVPCQDITKISGLGIPTFWSYHPAYLNRIKKIDHTVNIIHNTNLARR